MSTPGTTGEREPGAGVERASGREAGVRGGEPASGHRPAAGANGYTARQHLHPAGGAKGSGGGAAGERRGELLRPDVFPGSVTFNRDLSWLAFNRRVLALAMDQRTPLLERVKFLAIFSSNLDEFVMKRMGLLRRRITEGRSGPDQDGLAATTLLEAMRANIREMLLLQAECFEYDVKPALAKQGVELAAYEDLSAEDREWLRRYFRTSVFPILTPLAVDTGHRFPFISNLSRNFGVMLSEPARGAQESAAGNDLNAALGGGGGVGGLFARVKIPSVLPQWIELPPRKGGGQQEGTVAGEGAGGKRYVSLRDVIHQNLDDLFPGMQVQEVTPFRVTRDSEDHAKPGEADNLLDQVEQELRRRRFAHAVRLEVGANPSQMIVRNVCAELDLHEDDVDERFGPLDYTNLWELVDQQRAELMWPKWTPVVPRRFADRSKDIFEVIREGDVLVHHPFESFHATAERFIHEAARDPDVLAIKQTIYRTSPDSPFVRSMIRAAESGKQVAVLVELRARFDEQRNVKLARMLEKAGAHVAYGVVGYKTHCKAALVVRRERDGMRAYSHFGTGNYHPKTALLYTDLGLFTCDRGITEDAVELFNLLTGRSKRDIFETVLVAPINMKQRFIALIDREAAIARRYAAGQSAVNGRILAKMNALADPEITERLYAASRAGVEIMLFVRGFCCLRPEVEGLSENIRVVSVLGRFLEHSRIFHFGAGHDSPLDGEWYISSADWMYRNLNHRVEAACPVLDRSARARLWRILEIMSQDRRKAWDLRPDGSYVQRMPRAGVPADSPEVLGTFETLMREAGMA